ncbi:PhnD/SsuA/transferrin family substrate-binding protein [Methylomicrobium sp. RS1]|uniref:PhnD/SsuA/transferrin family substrate-binding protein n=1 Tax=Candidatus Methylomicrobium oryzae TaxID=2802053 RepID=UPI0019209B30|nr:PhnD/SsuA/transferrin family substrate-binding protein [Methylomicrobium sp. RS1]MBL1262124.1 PhnD/SsuA/transferrin family substrate-binding protein [Methylomicrobium sp. RS1]
MSSMISSFSIQPVSEQDNRYCYNFIGSIDAHANPVLEPLTAIPSKAHVLLDFSQVDRVNSMGLSLLLKLFEEWERKKIRVEVQSLDRMISMLFKITGLGRFVKSDGNSAAAGAFPAAAVPAPRDAEARQKSSDAAPDKLNFVASLQSGQQLTGWYLLNTYLQRRMKKAIHFEQSAEHLDGDYTDLLFAKPFEACAMIKRYGFVPAMRPVAEVDEVVLLTRVDDQRTLHEYQGVCVGTATKDSFVYLLGRFLCDESGIDSTKFTYDFAGNEIKALQSLIRKKCDLVFMLKKSYEGLSSFSRNNVRKLDESETHFACHLFCVAPHLQDEGKLLADILKDMENDEQGRTILRDIQISGWCKPEPGEVQMLQMVYDRYAS